MAELNPETTFLIEIRLGRTKWRIKRITEKITKSFSIAEFEEKHPHVTLFGPFSLKQGVTERTLLDAIEKAAAPYLPVPFLLNGYEMNQGLNGAVIAYKVVPTGPLTALNAAISSSVRTLAKTVNVWDTDPGKKWFHVTIANRLDRERGSGIFSQLAGRDPETGITVCPTHKSRDPQDFGADSHNEYFPEGIPRHPVLDEDGVRISVIAGEDILAEYDLGRHRWFSPDVRTRAPEWQTSLRQFRVDRGIELTGPRYSNRHEIFVISDLHLGHANIIRYCSRPFPHDAPGEMDEVLIRNWNYTVKPGDTVFHLGDLCYGTGKDPADYLRQLNGSVVLIAGNHDRSCNTLAQTESVTWEHTPFTLVHDPCDAPAIPGAWIIHGHHHNNDLDRFPFISARYRQINVSAEVVGYRPVSLTELIRAIRYLKNRPAEKRILLREPF